MLKALHIENIVLIEKLSITFQSGLCALTGETGAGKSILLDSLGLALGNRADLGLIRKGADKGLVIAEFDLEKKHPVWAILDELEISHEFDLTIRRSLTKDGRSKIYINDLPYSLNALRQIGPLLGEIHGQFDTHGLFDPSTHIDYLDSYAALESKRKNVEGAYKTWKIIKKDLDQQKAALQKAQEEQDYLSDCRDELEKLAPEKGEEEELTAKRNHLKNNALMVNYANNAQSALNGDKGAEGNIRQSMRALERLGDKDNSRTPDLLEKLDNAFAVVEGVNFEISEILRDLYEPEVSVESVDDRFFALKAAARKHQCVVDDLPELLEKIIADLESIHEQGDMLAELEQKLIQAEAAYLKSAGELSLKRKAKSKNMAVDIGKELAPLKLGRAEFIVHFEQTEHWGPHGMDDVSFRISTNPGTDPGPLNKVASGGELARMMLAIKVILAKTSPVATLIFDEVDTGIGGATAAAVGERLVRVAMGKQVLVVTHAPQVAACAGTHLHVKKFVSKDNLTRTSISPLDKQARLEEIARMLSGAEITPEARAAANKLLDRKAA
jgi:DNA repair protein RecN (Recombination protein N)